MRHFTKYLLLCLAIIVLPDVIKAQNNITLGDPSVCDIDPIEIVLADDVCSIILSEDLPEIVPPMVDGSGCTPATSGIVPELGLGGPYGRGMHTLRWTASCGDLMADCAYIINVTGGNGPSCSANQDQPIPACDQTLGSTTIIAENGTPPYMYSINSIPGGDPMPAVSMGPQAAATFSNLPVGFYLVTVIDDTGCESVCPVTIKQNIAPNCSVAIDSEPICGQSNGQATVTAMPASDANSGAAIPIVSYSWSTGVTYTPPETATGLSDPTLGMGTSYSVTVTDENGCETVCSVTMTDQAGPTCDVEETAPATCGDNTGAATATVTGGTGPYDYSWSNGQTTMASAATTDEITGLAAGTYTVTITDGNGCEITCDVTLDAVITGGIGVDFSDPANPVCTGFVDEGADLGAGVCTFTMTDIFNDLDAANPTTNLCVIHPTTCTPGGANTFTLEILIDGVVLNPMGMTEFGAGTYTITYRVTDNCSGVVHDCEVTYTITQDPDDVLDVLACNNTINATLSADCEVVVNADMMLEGNSTCYEGYSFVITNAAGTVLSGSTISSPGTYQVQVFDATGDNSCWGTVVAEDKIPPVIECTQDDLFACTDDLTPGADIESGDMFMLTPEGDGAWTNSDNPTAADSSVCLTMNFPDPVMSGSSGAEIVSVSLDIDISHTNITDLKAILISPDGDSVNVFTTPLGSATDPNCERDDIIATFSDAGTIDYNLLDVDPTCRLQIQPSVLGNFRPEEAFSGLNGGNPYGTYKLVIADCNPGTNGGMVNTAKLSIRYATGDTIPYPTTGTYTLDPASGEGCYTIDHEDGDCGPSRACYTDEIIDDCLLQNGIFRRVERTWTVWDASGNMDQATCTFNIQGSDLNARICPRNFDGLGGNPYFTCQDIFEMDDNGNPHPNVTGRPMDGSSNNMEFCGNVEMTYTDTRIDICSGSYKIIREWLLVDWCDNGQPVTCSQIIKVADTRPPITTCSIVDCHEVPVTDAFTCLTSFDVPPPIVLNECGGYTWSVSYLPASMVPGFDHDPYDLSSCPQPDNALTAGLFIPVDITRTDQDSTPITITGLPIGQTWIRYTVIDDCGNASPSGAGACEIRVVDEIEPTAVCDQHTTVSLNFECKARINAQTFDDLSYDSCGDIVLYEARKEGGTYGPFVEFGKADLQGPVKINMRVTDQAGNTNFCWAEVITRDKYRPIFTSCPDDVTIDCDYTDEQLQAAIGSVSAEDNCPDCFDITMTTGDPSQNSCGDGSISITWDLFDTNQLDGDGNPLKVDACVQQISFANSAPFNETNISWPSDMTDLTGCGLDIDPTVTGSPTLTNNGACSLTAVSHDDLVFYEVDDACLKILRTWTVIDWCQHEENVVPVQGRWTHIQVLKISNTVPPALAAVNDVQVCANETCDASYSVDLIATDDCTPTDEILWSYTIDNGSDGTIDDQQSGITVDSVLNLSGSLPVGTHAVKVYLEDHCGNVSDASTFNIVISDCKEPTPYCYSSTTTVVMPSNGSVEIWAVDYNIASTDQCPGDLTYSFSSNPSDNVKTLTCADLRDGVRRVLELEMWVHDAAGNSDFCNIKLDLQDNGTGEGACPDTLSPSAAISGFIFTEQNEMVNNVAVQVTSAQPEFPINFTTTNTGDYTFANLLTGYSYDITSDKNDDHINGVSTLDLVLIQKHILGLVLLDSPYKVIAADTDNNQYVSAADLVTLRKLILGQIVEYPNGQRSWRFVDEDHTFNNVYNPFPYDEQVGVSNLNWNENNMNFMAVKIGDVNATVNPTSYTNHITEVRSNQVVEFAMEEIEAQQGETINIPVTANNFEDLLGFQFTMEFDVAAMEFVGLEKVDLAISEENLGLTNLERGLIAVSWNDVEATSFDSDDVLFTLSFKANQATKLSDVMSMNSRVTNAEAYSSDLSMVNTKLVFRDGDATTFEVAQFELYQNNPNPFNNETSIGFNLAESGEAVLSVYDVTGKMLIRIVEDYSKGYNQVSLNTTDLSGMQGVMYYTLESKGHTATKKMVGVR